MLGLHPLVAEDILEQNQRSKIEETGGVLHVVMFALRYAGEIVSHELDIVLGSRWLLTSHDGDLDLRDAQFRRREPDVHLDEGVDFTLWVIADWLVDDYFPVFDRLGDEIDQLENDVMRRPSNWIVERLFAVRRDLLTIRHTVTPQREIFNQLTNRDLRLIKPERVIYFRDVYDHLIRLTDELDTYRELVGTAIDIYLSQVNNNLSETVKKLTVATVILAGAGAAAGIFGMSEVVLALSFAEPRFWLVTGAIVADDDHCVCLFQTQWLVLNLTGSTDPRLGHWIGLGRRRVRDAHRARRDLKLGDGASWPLARLKHQLVLAGLDRRPATDRWRGV